VRRGPSIGRLLVGLNAFVLLVPILALVLLRIYESHLIEQTERRLIGEAAVVGESYRQFLFEARGQALGANLDMLPPTHHEPTFWSVRPIIDLSDGLAPDTPEVAGRTTPIEPAAEVAGARLKTMLDRVKRLNLSSVRVLDQHGCLVASTAREGTGNCLTSYPEVATALAESRYAAVARRRYTDARDRRVPPDGISRSGDVRVFVVLPIFYQGDIIGAVRMGRTSLNTVEALWRHRGTLVWAGLACLLLTLGVSGYLTRTIGRPMRAISTAARAISRGEPRTLSPTGTVPAEVADMSASLDQMTEQLSERARYVQDFAATVSHELKTPIAGIRGATELLTDSWDSMAPEQRQRFLANIDADAVRMQALVTRLLELARIENPEDGASVAAQTFDPVAAIQALCPSEVAVMGDVGSVTMRRDYFESAVRNLVDNALDHGAAPVEVRVKASGGRVAVEVRDAGAGVSEGNRGRLFERFFTTRRDSGGTGLGLSIAKAVAESRGGDLTYGRDDATTVFTLTV